MAYKFPPDFPQSFSQKLKMPITGWSTNYASGRPHPQLFTVVRSACRIIAALPLLQVGRPMSQCRLQSVPIGVGQMGKTLVLHAASNPTLV